MLKRCGTGFRHALLLFFLPIFLLCTEDVHAADVRQEAFRTAAEAFVRNHVLPTGDSIDKELLQGDFGENQLALADVDMDGKPELLVRFQSGPTFSMQEFVCGFDESRGEITIMYEGFPELEYFTNGCIKEKARRNRTAGGTFWPYTLICCDAKKGSCEEKGRVYGWSRKAYPTDPRDDEPFPQKIDVTGDGFVYFISDPSRDESEDPAPVDTPVYEAWVSGILGGADPLRITWVPATPEGIKALSLN
ncbi:MAG: hypothetical protein K5657_00510 [Desulfovibrio sp.]|nr:hypothetical protein [Desulfovibrio sp.]